MAKDIPETITCEKCGTENNQGVTHCTKCGGELYHDLFKGMQLRNMVITLGLFLVPFIIFFYVVNFEASRHFETQVKRQLGYSVETNFRAIKNFLKERKQDLLSLSSMDINKISDVRSMEKFLDKFIRGKPCFDFVAMADPSGQVVYSTNDMPMNIADREYFRRSMDGEFYNSGIFHSDLFDTSAMIISAPLYNRHEKQVGIVLASISLKALYNLILDLRIGETSEVFLVDENGIFLSPSRLGGMVLSEYGYCRDEANPHTGGGGTLMHRDYRGENVICANKRFEEFRGYLVSEMDVDEALGPVNRLRTLTFYIFLVFGAFLIFSSIFFSRRVTNLLKNLTAALRSTLEDLREKKATIDTINAELRKRLHDCQSLGKQLKASEEYVKNIVNSISSGVLAIDRELKITYFNDSVRRLSSMTDISTNMDLYEAFPSLKNDALIEAIERIFSRDEPFSMQRLHVTGDGRDLIISISGFPIMRDSRISGATLLLHDITEEVKMHDQMADYEKLSALSQVALGAAHEINNPLLGITSYIELLLEEEKEVGKKAQAKQVLDSAYRISETIRGLLNFARPSPPMFTKININKLISETVSFLNYQPLFRKIKIDQQLDESVTQITADANQIRQVLLNIFLNSAQAMTGGGTITVSSQKVKYEDQVEIRITDTGVGISTEDLEHVFDPFFTTKKGEGTGLGLSISYSYVKNHNGKITISSEQGRGTAVTLTLPLRQQSKIQSEVVE